MASFLLVSATGPERRVALVEHGQTTEVMVQPSRGERLVGSIFKGRVVRVLPGMQSAFIEVGLQRTAFLFAGDLPDDREHRSVKDGDDDPPTGLRPIAPINERLTEGQDLIVQVAKEPMGTKGARVTTQITLPGRYVVYMPTVGHVGVSRRIEDSDERERLRTLAAELCPQEGGLIVRTAGEHCGEAELREDLEFLLALWTDIRKRAEAAKPPAELHRELDVALMAVRDRLRPDFEAVLVDSEAEAKRLATFLERVMPRCRPLLQLDQKTPPLFTRYGVEHEISRALERKVWLKSGGYIVIEHTEALTTIDVNTGRYVGKTNFEDTVLKINLEAVKEICFQLRLRNIGGIIVIDFIDMAEPENRRQVEEALAQMLAADKVRTRVLCMSALGLIEMTRKRVSPSLNQMMAQTCEQCDGRGWTLSRDEIARQVIAKVRDSLASRPDIEELRIEASPRVVEALFTDYGDQLSDIERRSRVHIHVSAREPLGVEQYEVRGS